MNAAKRAEAQNRIGIAIAIEALEQVRASGPRDMREGVVKAIDLLRGKLEEVGGDLDCTGKSCDNTMTDMEALAGLRRYGLARCFTCQTEEEAKYCEESAVDARIDAGRGK